MSDISQQIDNRGSDIDQNDKEHKVSQFSEIATKLIDKLVDKDVQVAYTFDHLEIDVPSAHGPGGRELGGAKWVIDGKIIISTTSAHNDSKDSKYVTS